MNNTNFPVFDVSEEYKEIMEEAAEKKIGVIILNSTFEHAVLLTYHLIKNAKEEIKIFTSVSDLVYRDARIKRIMENATKKGVKVKILLESKKPFEDKVFLNNALVEYQILEKNSKLRNHFLISDNSGFGIEEKHSEFQEKELYLVKSRVSFNSPEVCECLHKIFDSAFLKAGLQNDTIKS